MLATALAAAGLVVASPAGADPPAKGPSPNEPATFPAGAACEGFGVSVTIDVDRQRTKTFFDKNGSPVRETVTGRIVLTVTNATTLESRTFRLGGSTHITFEENGSVTFVITGHDLIVLFPTDIPPGPSTTQNTGRLEVNIAPDGTFTVVSLSGRALDVCAELAL
jgi:hypothetical protein